MHRNQGALLIALGLLCALVWVGLFGCNDKPTDPKPVEPKNYTAYFYQGERSDSNWYFEYIPETNELDSFFLPCGGGLVVSADGSQLYTKDRNRGETAIVDLVTREVTGYLPYTVVIAASPDNRLLAVAQYERGFSIIRTRDYAEIYFDSTILGGLFSSNSQNFYGLMTDYSVMRLSLANFSIWSRQFTEGSVNWVVPSPDERKLFLYMAVGPNAQHMFAVYDFESDSIIFRDYFFPGGGFIQTERSGRYAFYTNPPSMLWGGGEPWVRVYDIGNNQSGDSISTVGIFPEPYEYGIPMTFMAVAPDNNWLVILPYDWPYVAAVDLRSMSITRYRHVEGHYTLMGLACQTGR